MEKLSLEKPDRIPFPVRASISCIASIACEVKVKAILKRKGK